MMMRPVPVSAPELAVCLAVFSLAALLTLGVLALAI